MEFFKNYLETLPYELKENIFKHLDLNDILILSLVSKTMNEAVGQSSLCMSKIWIKFYSFNMKDLTCLGNSVRNYKKLKINRVKLDGHYKFLIELQQKWKKVLIYNCEFKNFNTFYELIESFAETVSEIEISDVEILSNDQKIEPLKFPMLKRFMLRNVTTEVLEIFRMSSKKLNVAAFDIPQGAYSLHNVTNEILRASPNLKLLQLGPQYIKELFSQGNDYKFKLKSLLLKFSIVNDLSDNEEQNISKFITHQNDINWLAFMELKSNQLLKSAWSNTLKRISFIGLEDLFDSEMSFAIDSNLTITHMDFICRKVLISHLKKFLTAAPRVTHIHVKILNKHMLEYIFKNHFAIRSLLYEHAEEDAIYLYSDIIKSQRDDVNKKITLIKKSFWFTIQNPFSIDPTFWRN